TSFLLHVTRLNSDRLSTPQNISQRPPTALPFWHRSKSSGRPANSFRESERLPRACGATLHPPPADGRTWWCRRYFLRFSALGHFRASRAVSSQGGRPTQEENLFGRRGSCAAAAGFPAVWLCPIC